MNTQTKTQIKHPTKEQSKTQSKSRIEAQQKLKHNSSKTIQKPTKVEQN